MNHTAQATTVRSTVNQGRRSSASGNPGKSKRQPGNTARDSIPPHAQILWGRFLASLTLPGLLGLLAVSLILTPPARAYGQERTLFKFESPTETRPWRNVNDNVMGGRSDGRFRITDDNKLVFFGNLSLANNGGFASVRARSGKLGLRAGDVIVVRLRGDGRTYSFNVYTQSNLSGFSFRQSFRTKKDKWIEVRFPVDKFVATWRGRVYANEAFLPSQAAGLGFLLGDKRPGPFKLEIEWIKVSGTTAAQNRNPS